MTRAERLKRAEGYRHYCTLPTPTEVADDIRFLLDEVGRFDHLRDENRALRLKIELIEHHLRVLRETTSGR